MYEARYWVSKGTGILCQVCPRSCVIEEGNYGHCFVRKNIGSKLISTTYGRCHGLVIDPVEKKPLYHFYPGSKALSFGTIGCNLACEFCQNWHMSQVYDDFDNLMEASPEYIAQYAQDTNCQSVAFTYNDPVIFMEYAIDTAIECHKRGIKTISVSNGYMNIKPARELYSYIDAANIDLKSFTEDFYAKYTDAHLKPVLKLLTYLAKETKVWLEITTLIIPGFNDNEDELINLSKWVKNELGENVPLHFSAFFPMNKFLNVPRTPKDTLIKAREIAMKEGLNFVYIGNTDVETATYCPNCHSELITRSGFSTQRNFLTVAGKCKKCNYVLPGYFNESLISI